MNPNNTYTMNLFIGEEIENSFFFSFFTFCLDLEFCDQYREQPTIRNIFYGSHYDILFSFFIRKYFNNLKHNDFLVFVWFDELETSQTHFPEITMKIQWNMLENHIWFHIAISRLSGFIYTFIVHRQRKKNTLSRSPRCSNEGKPHNHSNNKKMNLESCKS